MSLKSPEAATTNNFNMVRFKNRYVVLRCKGSGRDRVAPGALIRQIKQRVSVLYGDFGAGCIMNSLQVKFYDAESGVFVVRVGRSELKEILDVLQESGADSAPTSLRATIDVIHVAGSPRQCNSKLEKLTPKGATRPWNISY